MNLSSVDCSGVGLKGIEPLYTRYLEHANPLKYDKLIRFVEEGHIYYVKSPYIKNVELSKDDGGGSIKLISVTGVIGKYFPSGFDAVLLRIFNSDDHKRRLNEPGYRYEGCDTPDKIREIWSQGAKDGTRMHAFFEDMANLFEYARANQHFHPEFASIQRTVDVRIPEYRYFAHFMEKFGIYEGRSRFFRTEYCMFHPELHLTGMIDCLLHNTDDDTYTIIDYKRCKKGVSIPSGRCKPVEQLKASGRGRIIPSLTMLRNNSYTKYGIQLSLYKEMFERMFREEGYKIRDMYLIVVDSTKIGDFDALKCIKIPVTKYAEHVKDILRYRADEIMESFTDAMSHEHVTAVNEYSSFVLDQNAVQANDQAYDDFDEEFGESMEARKRFKI